MEATTTTKSQHTNGALATQPHQINAPAQPFAPLGAAFRMQIRAIIQEEIGKVVREELQAALSGAVAPAFHVPVGAVSPRITNAMQQCNEAGCTRAVRSKGKCSAHYQQTRRMEMKKTTTRTTGRNKRK